MGSLLCIISNVRGTEEVPEGLPEGPAVSKARQETEGTIQRSQSPKIRDLSLYVLLEAPSDVVKERKRFSDLWRPRKDRGRDVEGGHTRRKKAFRGFGRA